MLNRRFPDEQQTRVTGGGAEQVLRRVDAHLAVARGVRGMAAQIAEAAELVARAMNDDHKLMLCGNGGSAADAQHLAAEFTGRFVRERRALPAMALNVNCSAVTAIANDYSWEHVFVRELEAHGREGDVLIAISTSGDSPNVLRVAERARQLGIVTVGMTGQNGGELATVVDRCLQVPSANVARIQEMHILIGHMVCELVEQALC